jgi:probable F420-dependent oxidoreductase
MNFGVYLPNFGAELSAMHIADLAYQAEQAGWHGLFLWDHILYSKTDKLVMVDPWVALTAAAMRTNTLRLGTTVTPLARRRPWVLARQLATLDQLSGGRIILGVGLGEPGDAEFGSFGEETSNRLRASRLDESLDILAGLWSGKPFSYQGQHYQLEKMTFLPTPVQRPHVPIWVGGFWPNRLPFQRAARWDGAFPIKYPGWLTAQEVREILAYIRSFRKSQAPFDIVVMGSASGLGKTHAKIAQSLSDLEDAGVTWWLQSLYLQRNAMADLVAAVQVGPPRQKHS